MLRGQCFQTFSQYKHMGIGFKMIKSNDDKLHLQKKISFPFCTATFVDLADEETSHITLRHFIIDYQFKSRSAYL